MVQGIFTLLYNQEYLPGALVVGVAVGNLVGNESRIVKGILIDKSEFLETQLETLGTVYDELIDVQPIKSDLGHLLENKLGRAELAKTFTKVQLWALTEYEKVLYLDCDTVPNVHSSGGTIVDLLQVDIPLGTVAASPDSGFPDVFNSGVMLLRPRLEDYEKLKALTHGGAAQTGISFDGADQGLLNQYFNPQPDWVHDLVVAGKNNVTSLPEVRSSSWIQLPFLYNVTPSAQYEYFPAFDYFASNPASGELELMAVAPVQQPPPEEAAIRNFEESTISKYHQSALTYFSSSDSKVKLLHYIGPHKPWNQDASTAYGPWWDLWRSHFGSQSIDSVVNGPANQPRPGPLSLEPSFLCDPETYKTIPSTVSVSADALWDPAVGPPPSATDEPCELEHSSLDPDKLLEQQISPETTSNEPQKVTDSDVVPSSSDTDAKECHEQPSKEPLKEELDQLTKDTSQPLEGPPQDTIDTVTASIEVPGETSTNVEVSVDPEPAIDTEQLTKELEQLKTVQQDPTPIYNESTYEKVFPWEHRATPKPERSFDNY